MLATDDEQEQTILGEEQTSKFRLKLEDFSFRPPSEQSSIIRRTLRSNVRNSGSQKNRQTENSACTSVSNKRSPVQHDNGRAKKRRGYAAPEAYAHLNSLTDCIEEYLDVLFCGINPGVRSATVGHHFAHPGNRFYKMLYGSGFTDRLVRPDEDSTLPALYNIGLTNIVNRPSSCEGELSAEEMISSVPTLLQKVSKFKPRFVCFIGKGMAQKVEKGFKRAIDSREMKANNNSSIKRRTKTTTSTTSTGKMADRSADSGIGLRPFKITHPDATSRVRETLFFVSHSSSGLAASMNLQDKINVLKELRELLVKHKTDALDTSSFDEVPIS